MGKAGCAPQAGQEDNLFARVTRNALRGVFVVLRSLVEQG